MPDKPLWLAHIPKPFRRWKPLPTPGWIEPPSKVFSTSAAAARNNCSLPLPAGAPVPISSLIAGPSLRILSALPPASKPIMTTGAGNNSGNSSAKSGNSGYNALPVLVELPNSQLRRVERHDFDGLPDGVKLTPGTITLSFREPEEALQKLLALAIAIGENRQAFEERVALPDA
jgi:hypothetical protein